jgi:ribosome-binding factor A
MSGRNDRSRERDARGRSSTGRPGTRGAPRAAASGDDGGERVARVGERIRAELADMLLRGEIRDPAASGAIVSAVTVTRDLSLARVFLRVLEASPSEARRREVVAAFDRARGHVRRELSARIARGSGAMRSVPELRFAWDDTTDRAARLDAVLAEVAADRAREAAERARDASDDGSDDGGPR